MVTIVACLAPCAAWHATTVPMARSTVRKVSMVAWDSVPRELMWAKSAWDNLGLTSSHLNQGDECFLIPNELTPDPSREVSWGECRTRCARPLLPLHLLISRFVRAMQWFFCSTAATYNSDVDCYDLPMQTAGRNVHICSMPRGARPGYADD